MAKFVKLVQSETALVGAENLTQAKETSSTLARMDQNVTKISQKLENLEMRGETTAPASAASEIKQILQPSSSAEDRLNSMNRSRIPDTGEWVKHKKEFVSWINRTVPVLWISGNPGAGKSYIACTIVNYLKDSLEKIDPLYVISTGFFFFKDDNPKTRSVHQALRDIAFQIGQNNPVYAEYLKYCIDASDNSSSLSLSTLWQRLFIDFFGLLQNRNQLFYILLDALDESFVEERLEFFELARDLLSTGHIQLLMLGRPQIAEEMNELIGLLQVPTLHVSEANNLQDIVQYINTRVSRSMYLKKLPTSFKSEIAEKLSANSQGMFLWVELVFQELTRLRSVSGIQKVLHTAPKGLSNMVSRILTGLSETFQYDPQHADELNELLAWVLSAQRPLTLKEIESILKWRSLDGKGWIWLEGSLRIQFASIFSVNRQDGMTTADLPKFTNEESTRSGTAFKKDLLDTGLTSLPGELESHPETTTVAFNHAYWGEFFRSSDGKVTARDGSPSIGVEHHEAHILALTRCLEFLCDINSPDGDSYAILRRYARQSLTFHLKTVDIKKMTPTKKQFTGFRLARLLTDEKIIEKFVPLLDQHFFSTEIADLFLRWLGDPDIRDGIPAELRNQLDQYSAQNYANILSPIAKHMAKVWLSKQNSWFEANLCTSVYKFIALEKFRQSSQVDFQKQMVEATEWTGCLKDSTWYGIVGKAPIERNVHGPAIEHFQKALSIDPSSKKARTNLALAYAVTRYSQRAIDLDLGAVGLLESQEPSPKKSHDLHSVYERLAHNYRRLEDWPNCILAAEKGHATSIRCIQCADLLLWAYNRAGRRDDGFSFIQRLNEIPSITTGTVLTDILNARPSTYEMLWLGIGAIILRTNSSSFFIRAYTQALTFRPYRPANVTASLQLCLSYIYTVYAYDSIRAGQICLQLVRDYGNSLAEGATAFEVDRSLHRLAANYFSAYLRSSRTEADTKHYLNILQDLSRGRLPDDNLSSVGRLRVLPNPMVEIILGQFYGISGLNLEAKKIFGSKLKPVLDSLGDSSSVRNWYIFHSLAKILFAMGDESYSAGAIYQCDTIVNQESGNSATLELLDGSRSFYIIDEPYICDGCGSSCAIDGFSVCSYCEDTGFCEACFSLLRAGNLPVNLCHPKHNLVLITPRPQDVKVRSLEHRSMLYVDGEWLTVYDFKSRLEAKYEL